MIGKYNRQENEAKQISHGMCYGERYNCKKSEMEICKHRDECELYYKFLIELKRREKHKGYFTGVKDFVGLQYIKDWRKCEVWKTKKYNRGGGQKL